MGKLGIKQTARKIEVHTSEDFETFIDTMNIYNPKVINCTVRFRSSLEVLEVGEATTGTKSLIKYHTKQAIHSNLDFNRYHTNYFVIIDLPEVKRSSTTFIDVTVSVQPRNIFKFNPKGSNKYEYHLTSLLQAITEALSGSLDIVTK